MGRHKIYTTKEKQAYARKLRNQRYYNKHRNKLNAKSMQKYWNSIK